MSQEGYDLVIGLGATGRSVIRYLTDQGMPVRALDSRQTPADLDKVKADYPQLRIHCGSLRNKWLENASRLIVSPGVAVSTPPIAAQMAAGKEVVGDIELFVRAISQPLIAITGSNAKTTVTTLMGEVAAACGMNPGVGGNIGIPALSLLNEEHGAYVLELSSFQLETTYSLSADVACLLNISQDHLDRYSSFADYQMAKQRIFDNCRVAVWNRDDLASKPDKYVPHQVTFGTDQEADFRLDTQTNQLLCRGQPLMSVESMALTGRHNMMNVLAVLAMVDALQWDMDTAVAVCKTFAGLPHRCQQIADSNGVRWINDSKATNVGATQAALEGVGSSIAGKLVLIGGGQGKGQDFSPLAPPATKYVRLAVLFGEDKAQLANALTGVPVVLVDNMAEAVRAANDAAEPGDAVLLSPACASFDQYSGFAARGDDFSAKVLEVIRG